MNSLSSSWEKRRLKVLDEEQSQWDSRTMVIGHYTLVPWSGSPDCSCLRNWCLHTVVLLSVDLHLTSILALSPGSIR